jgi:hypothetical protein
VALSFAAALRAGAGAAACSMLTSNAYSAASGATGTPCAKAIGSIKVDGSAVTSVQVWGDAAQVRLGRDVLFLRRVSGRWRISAAGCQPQPDGPYKCTVSN